MRHTLFIINILLFSIILSAQTVFLGLIDETEITNVAEENVKRVLTNVAYDDSDEELYEEPAQTIEFNSIRERLELIFNYWNVQIEYKAISKPYPTMEELEPYDGIITFYQDNQTDDPAGYIDWLIQVSEHGKKLMIFEQPGLIDSSTQEMIPMDTRNKLWKLFGLREEEFSTYTEVPVAIASDPLKISNFERNLDKDLFQPFLLKPINTQAEQHSLSIKLNTPETPETVIAAYSDNGTYIQTGFMSYYSQLDDTFECYYLDLFRFLGLALDRMKTPIPDCTTLLGKRIAFQHIDGDGFNSISKVDNHQNCSEIFYHEYFKKNPEVLIGVSVIVNDINPDYMGSEKATQMAKKIFKLPNVELATHTTFHPINWRTGTYYRGAEYKFSAENEIDNSIHYINKNLAPEGKKVRAVYWSGYCNPSEVELQRVKNLGVYNINGGNNIPDMLFPSYTQFSCMGKKRGNNYQQFAVINNENDYTNLWKGPYWGFRNVIKAYEFTDKRYRIKPIDFYYHFYSSEFVPSFNAIRSNMRWILKQNVIQVFPSKYLGTAENFFQVDTKEIKPDTFQISKLKILQNLRVESEVIPNLSNPDILGFCYDRGRTYIHLKPDCGETIVRLTKKKPAVPYIVSANIYNIHIEKRTNNYLAIHAGAPIDNFTSDILFQLPGKGKWQLKLGKKTVIITPDLQGNFTLKKKLNVKKTPIILQRIVK